MSKLLSKSRVLTIAFAITAIGGCSEADTEQDPDPSLASEAGLPNDVSPIVRSAVASDAAVADVIVTTPLEPTTDAGVADESDASHGDSGDEHDGGERGGHVDDAAVPGPVADGTFASVYAVLSASCVSCHGAGKAMDLSSPTLAHSSLVNVPASMKACGPSDAGTVWTRIVPGSLELSLLVQKLEGHAPCGSQMPMKVLLPQETIEVVRAWVTAGAPAP